MKNKVLNTVDEDRRKVLLKNLNLDVYAGDIIAILGSNGVGKSTLIKTLCNLHNPLNGNVYINKRNIQDLSQKQIAESLSVVLTDHLANENMSVFETVSFGRYPFTNWIGKLSENDIEIINTAIEDVGMSDFIDRKLYSLSDGEKQRVLIAKALAQESPLILLDEPIAHLDLVNRIEVLKLLRRFAKKKNIAVLLSIHELDLAIQSADKLWLLKTDQSVDVGAPEDIIIDDKILTLFKETNLVFDKYLGRFEMPYESTKSFVNLEYNDSYIYNWTLKALQKSGYQLSNNSDVKLKINAEKQLWKLYYQGENQTFSSISNLIEFLNSMDVSAS
jgi:iron complex transport system ATP-binding protein